VPAADAGLPVDRRSLLADGFLQRDAQGGNFLEAQTLEQEHGNFLLGLCQLPGVDLLPASREISGYQSYPTREHGQVGAMTIAEQVAGRRNRIQFEIVLIAKSLQPLLDELKKAFPVRDIIYWVLPVAQSGRLSGGGW